MYFFTVCKNKFQNFQLSMTENIEAFKLGWEVEGAEAQKEPDELKRVYDLGIKEGLDIVYKSGFKEDDKRSQWSKWINRKADCYYRGLIDGFNQGAKNHNLLPLYPLYTESLPPNEEDDEDFRKAYERGWKEGMCRQGRQKSRNYWEERVEVNWWFFGKKNKYECGLQRGLTEGRNQQDK